MRNIYIINDGISHSNNPQMPQRFIYQTGRSQINIHVNGISRVKSMHVPRNIQHKQKNKGASGIHTYSFTSTNFVGKKLATFPSKSGSSTS